MNYMTGMNLPRYEDQYIANLVKIRFTGTREKNARTGVETIRLPATQITVDMSRELPILTSKKIAWKTAIDEMLWIYVKNDSCIDNLRVPKIWEKTVFEDRTIGKSYGYQAGKSKDTSKYRNQLDYIIKTLKDDRSNRQCVIDLWDPEDLGEMALPPCIVSSVWSVIDNRLNCMITQRSADYPLGVPFDTFQFGVLMHIVAREIGVELGILTHNFGDSHIYVNQLDGVDTQLRQYEEGLYTPPTLEIADKPWYELTTDDFSLINYQHRPAVSFALN